MIFKADTAPHPFFIPFDDECPSVPTATLVLQPCYFLFPVYYFFRFWSLSSTDIPTLSSVLCCQCYCCSTSSSSSTTSLIGKASVSPAPSPAHSPVMLLSPAAAAKPKQKEDKYAEEMSSSKQQQQQQESQPAHEMESACATSNSMMLSVDVFPQSGAALNYVGSSMHVFSAGVPFSASMLAAQRCSTSSLSQASQPSSLLPPPSVVCPAAEKKQSSIVHAQVRTSHPPLVSDPCSINNPTAAAAAPVASSSSFLGPSSVSRLN